MSKEELSKLVVKAVADSKLIRDKENKFRRHFEEEYAALKIGREGKFRLFYLRNTDGRLFERSEKNELGAEVEDDKLIAQAMSYIKKVQTDIAKTLDEQDVVEKWALKLRHIKSICAFIKDESFELKKIFSSDTLVPKGEIYINFITGEVKICDDTGEYVDGGKADFEEAILLLEEVQEEIAEKLYEEFRAKKAVRRPSSTLKTSSGPSSKIEPVEISDLSINDTFQTH